MVSHDRRLLDRVTNCTWILRDKALRYFRLPCSEALQSLEAMDEADFLRNQSEQKEIERIEKSAKRLATWGQVYDNEDLSRKAKNMEKRVERLKDAQTELTSGTPWQLQLKGEALRADRLLSLSDIAVKPVPAAPVLFQVLEKQIKSGDRVAIVGRNGCGKSSLLKMLWRAYVSESEGDQPIKFHPRCRLGFYDQSLKQLQDEANLIDALSVFTDLSEEQRKMALISAGFPYVRHSQQVQSLSGGERSRLLLVGLTLANYHLLLLDEPTNHLDLAGKEELAQTLREFAGGFLLVTHDRDLIEASCNRYWLVQDDQLEEWHDIEQLYAVLEGAEPNQIDSNELNEVSAEYEALQLGSDASSNDNNPSEEEMLIDRLCNLEALLEADLSRKLKHQKPKLQQEWRNEISDINCQLGIE